MGRRNLLFDLLLFLSVLALPALPGAQPACPPDGDMDQSGSVTAADALLVFQQALGLAQIDACQRTIADVFPQPANPDGAITASDALCVFQNALGLPSCLDTLPAPNQPPVADAGSDQSVGAGVMVLLLGMASDPDGTIASHAWTQTGGTPVSLTGADAATAVFVAPELLAEEALTFRLTVTDDGGAQASDEVRVTVRGFMAPVDQASAADVFRQRISGPVLQSKCVNCHVANGASGHTRLVLLRATDTPDHEAQNLRTFQNFLAAVADEGGGSYILNKIQGVGHGGGVQVSPGTAEFANMQRFLSLLVEQVAPSAPVTVETLFDTVIMASPRKTLRRAALIFAGRIPTDEENAAVEAGDETVLRATIRGLMQGPQFHEFLLRASNDRLLTDRSGWIIDPNVLHFPDFANEAYDRKKAARAKDNESEFHYWMNRVQYGIWRAPLELIAYVVENDKPYTEILTADYIMANSWAAKAYGSSTYFRDPEDVHEFRPSRIVEYFGRDDRMESEYDPLLMLTQVFDPGPLRMRYPHAGVLNTTVFLHRYPTTPTNRNRARSRWTYYHFLGLDVEKSASRTTDPVALADTNNPTMHNPNCTVCHSILDPVAGVFQNYGDVGLYKQEWGGVDSLDNFYKNGKGPALPVQAESWADRDVLVWPLSLGAGVQTLRVMYTNHFWDEVTREHGLVNLDSLDVVDTDGEVVASVQFESLPAPVAHWGNCGEAQSAGRGGNDHFRLWSGYLECAFFLHVEIPRHGAYDVDVVAWSSGYDDRYYRHSDSGFAELSVVANGYQDGDVWYRDMRPPGFDGATAPSSDNSVQWLARRIVADPRFAKATVKFWWPAILGSEVAEFPEESTDAGFEGRLLAANAQNAEIVRLANGFRRGFHGGAAHNLKDLLVEIVLSKWFRADAVTDDDPARRTALRDAGARRLLTPEELARKTAAITGVQWGREFAWNRSWSGSGGSGLWNALFGDYRLFYGGIDSVGITERARDITSVMAGVAKRHAVQVGCPVVMRELYLLSDGRRRLFAGIKPTEHGEGAVKEKLVELHDKLLGVRVAPDSPDVEAAYRLFVDVSAHGKKTGEDWFRWSCDYGHDRHFLEGILDNAVLQRVDSWGEPWHEFDWDRVNDFLEGIDFSDPHHAAQAWVVVVTAMMMDYRYLYL